MILSTWTANLSNFFNDLNLQQHELVNIFLQLSTESSKYPQSHEKFSRFIEASLACNSITQECFSCINIYIDNKKIKGFLFVSVAFDIIDIDYLCVGNAYKRQGIALSLLQDLEQRIAKKPARLLLEVGERNLPARTLYENYGFSTSGVRKKYYRGEEDAICMVKNIL